MPPPGATAAGWGGGGDDGDAADCSIMTPPLPPAVGNWPPADDWIMTGVDDDWIWIPAGLGLSTIGVGLVPEPPIQYQVALHSVELPRYVMPLTELKLKPTAGRFS